MDLEVATGGSAPPGARKRNPMEDLKREIMIMRQMHHPNIVTLSEACALAKFQRGLCCEALHVFALMLHVLPTWSMHQQSAAVSYSADSSNSATFLVVPACSRGVAQAGIAVCWCSVVAKRVASCHLPHAIRSPAAGQ